MKPIPPALLHPPHPIWAALAGLFFELRTQSGISRVELARETTVSDEMIRLVETRVCLPRRDRAARLAEALGWRLSEMAREAEARAGRPGLG